MFRVPAKSAWVLTILAILAIAVMGRTEDLQSENKEYTIQVLPPKPRSHLRWSFRAALEACGLDAQFASEFFTFRLTNDNRHALNDALAVLDERIRVLSTNMSCASLLGDEELRLMPYVRREVLLEDGKFSVALDFSAPFAALQDRSTLAAHGHLPNVGTPAKPNIVLEDEAYELQRCLLVREGIHDVMFGKQNIVRYRARESFKQALQKPPRSVQFHQGNGWTSVWLGETTRTGTTDER